jgi:hypothetical protein
MLRTAIRTFPAPGIHVPPGRALTPTMGASEIKNNVSRVGKYRGQYEDEQKSDRYGDFVPMAVFPDFLRNFGAIHLVAQKVMATSHIAEIRAAAKSIVESDASQTVGKRDEASDV